MATSAFLTKNRALIGTCLASPGTGKYPETSTYMFWPTGVTAGWPTGALANYNRHKEMWTRKPQMVRLYSTSTNQPIDGASGVAGSAGAYGFISSDRRAIANDGAFLNLSFKYDSVSNTAGQSTATKWQNIANNLNSATDNGDKVAFRQLATNIRNWVNDSGNTATVKKIILGFHHEPENDGGTAVAFNNAFRAMVTYLARRGVGHLAKRPNVPLDGASAPGGAVGSFIDCIEWAVTLMGFQVSNFDYWPGEEFCLWMFVDPYNWGGGQSSPTGAGASIGRVPQRGDLVGANYAKKWVPLVTPLRFVLDWSDNHPEVLLGLGEFGTSEYVDQFDAANNSTIGTNAAKVASAVPGAKGEWYRQIPRLAQGLGSLASVSSLNAFTADPRATRIKAWLYWNDQAAMPRWFNTVPFQPNDTTQPTTTGAARSLSYDGFVEMVTDPYWNDLGGTVVVAPSVPFVTSAVARNGLDYTFTASTTPGSAGVTSWTFDWGDATDPLTLTGADTTVTAAHNYMRDGNYDVAVTVVASDGGTATRIYSVVVQATQEDIPQVQTYEAVTGAPYLFRGYDLANIRLWGNPMIDAISRTLVDRTTRRLIKVVSGTAYTLVPDDMGRTIEFSAATAVTVTVPANSTAAFPFGAYVRLVQMGAGQITVVGESGVTLNGPGAFTTRARYSQIEVMQLSILNSWLLSGDLTAGTGSGGGVAPGGGATTDDAFVFDFNEGPNGAAIATTNWNAHTGLDAVHSTDSIEGTYSAYWNASLQTSYYRKDMTAKTLLWAAFYVKFTAFPTANVYFAEWLNGASKVGDLRIHPDGKLAVRDNITQVTITANAIPVNTWVRVALRIQPGSATGHQVKTYYGANLNSTTASDAPTAGAATSTGQTALDTFRVGVITSSTVQFRMDRLRGNSTVEPSPIGA